MELLLNLAWLLLALPAYWLWLDRRGVRTRRFSRWQCLLTLGCMLIVLFPVISATDDLCAMRAELEESPAGKHSLRTQSTERLSASKWQTQPALISTFNFSSGSHANWHSLPAVHLSREASNSELRPGRAPPSTLLG